MQCIECIAYAYHLQYNTVQYCTILYCRYEKKACCHSVMQKDVSGKRHIIKPIYKYHLSECYIEFDLLSSCLNVYRPTDFFKLGGHCLYALTF